MTLHTKLSYVKSVLRILGYSLLIAYDDTLLTLAAVVLIGAELLGIAEEAWPGAYKGTETETNACEICGRELGGGLTTCMKGCTPAEPGSVTVTLPPSLASALTDNEK
jgi:hypothetical protein